MNYDVLEAGRRIRVLRKARGLTQEQLAEQIKTSTRHLQKLESGERGASVDTLVELAFFFHVSLDFLILGRRRTSDLQAQLREMAQRLENLAKTLDYPSEG